MQRVTSSCLFAICGLGLTAMAADATANELARTELIAAINVCQPALPTYEGAFRKRPRGIRNEGAQTAFLNCGLLTRGTTAKHTAVEIKLYNPTGSFQTVDCTLVDGPNLGDAPPSISITKSVSMNQFAPIVIRWDTTDNSGANYLLPALSCAVPAGVEVNHINDFYLEDIGF